MKIVLQNADITKAKSHRKKAPLELKEGRCSIIRAFFISASILLNVLLFLSQCWLAATITRKSSHGTCLVPVDILMMFLNSKKKTFHFFLCLSSNTNSVL